MTKRVVAYCRVSTEQESQAQSFENQVQHYQELFEKEGCNVGNCGALYRDKVLTLTTNGIYADEGISGAKTHQNREAFLKMIEDAKMGMFNKIYCKNIYRFSRDVEVGSKFIKDLRAIDVEVFFEDGALSTLNPASDLVINMILSVGQEESRAKSAASQWGIRENQKKGKYHGSITPYGYDVDDENYLIINEDEAKIVKKIFDMYYNEGYGTQKIARELNKEGISTRFGKKWSNTQITKIISNEVYKGKQITNKTQIDPTARFIQKEVPENKRIIHNFNHLVIIDEEYFDRVQEEKERRSKDWHEKAKKHRPSTKHLLSNLIKCGNCGGGFSRKKRKAYVRKDGTSKKLGYEWVCAINDKYGKNRCQYRNQIIEVDMIDKIKKEITRLQNQGLERLKDMYLFTYHDAEEKLKEKENLEKQLDKLNKQVELNFELLSDNIIDKLEYKSRNDKLQGEIKCVKDKLSKVISIDKEIAKVEKDFNYYISILMNTEVNKLTNARLKKLIDKIVVFTNARGKGYYIEWRFIKKTDIDVLMDFTSKVYKGINPDWDGKFII